MKRHWIALVVALAAQACGSSTPTRTTTPVRRPDGTTLTTGSGQAVSADAHARFVAAATTMRQHDEANNNRGDWTNDTCRAVAEQFEDAAEQQPNQAFPEAWLNRGLVFERCGMNDQARQSYNRALEVANEHKYCRARVQIGVMAYRQRDMAAARAAFEEATRMEPTRCVEGYTNLAMVLREQNPTTPQQWGEVVANIRRALALDDRYLPARHQLALAYLQQAGEDPHSQRIFLAGLVCSQAVQVAQSQSAELAPEVRTFLADIFNTWGVIDMRRGDIIRALDRFRRAYELNPTMFEAWVNYGTINLSFRGYQDAREAFQHAIELRPNDYDAHIGLGVALRGLSQSQTDDAQKQAMLQQAQQEYERARTLDQNRPDAYYNLGVLHESYMGGQCDDLGRARDLLRQFTQRATGQARYADATTRATRHISNIEQAIQALCNQPQGAAPAAPAAPAAGGGATPPAGGAAPPAGGAAPPAQ